MNMKIYISFVLMGLVAGCASLELRAPSPQAQKLRKRLDATPVKAAVFDKAPVKDAFSYLTAQSALQSPEGESITFVFPHEEDLQQPVSVNIPDSTLTDAIRMLCETRAMRYRIDDTAVYVSGCYDDPGPLSIRSYRLPHAVLRKWIIGDPTPENLLLLLRQCHVPFPTAWDGVFISYDADIQLLTAANTPDTLNLLGSFLDALQTEQPPER